MPLIENATSLATRDFLSIDKDGADTLVVCVSGSFQLPAPGRPASSEPVLTDEQPSPSPEDVYWGAPGTSSEWGPLPYGTRLLLPGFKRGGPPALPEPLTGQGIAESLGEPGAAAGVIQVGMALHARGSWGEARPGAWRTLVFGSSDGGAVGACVVEVRV